MAFITDRAPVYPKLVDELFPDAWHHSEHLRNDRTTRAIIVRHAFIQNLRRGHYHLTAGVPANLRLAVAFDELRQAV